jgi:hypothetical protein
MPELLKRLAGPCAMERLAPAVRCLRSVSSNGRMAFPLVAKLALLVRMSSTGGCSAQWVAWGAICPASADKSASGVWCVGASLAAVMNVAPAIV